MSLPFVSGKIIVTQLQIHRMKTVPIKDASAVPSGSRFVSELKKYIWDKTQKTNCQPDPYLYIIKRRIEISKGIQIIGLYRLYNTLFQRRIDQLLFTQSY